MSTEERLDKVLRMLSVHKEWAKGSHYAEVTHEELLEFEWFIKRVQELEELITKAEYGLLASTNIDLIAKNKRYRQEIKKAIGEFNYDEHHQGMSILLKVLEGDGN